MSFLVPIHLNVHPHPCSSIILSRIYSSIKHLSNLYHQANFSTLPAHEYSSVSLSTQYLVQPVSLLIVPSLFFFSIIPHSAWILYAIYLLHYYFTSLFLKCFFAFSHIYSPLLFVHFIFFFSVCVHWPHAFSTPLCLVHPLFHSSLSVCLQGVLVTRYPLSGSCSSIVLFIAHLLTLLLFCFYLFLPLSTFPIINAPFALSAHFYWHMFIPFFQLSFYSFTHPTHILSAVNLFLSI